ncbi:hypothetical protein PAXRUDRAFT_746330 [Paxillus rubicundulus Ve08.2h10]|uniref:Uncharacterized protein n=1 Tax=Paxillus rubicundulus Ve08.2h10 TaxID=930991 RepID=A0A0D0DC42_9AGAM|nr:hypothetical protein PAXRUDRAFT_746330 [Paxillus rubicundulus Ve08.2h10]
MPSLTGRTSPPLVDRYVRRRWILALYQHVLRRPIDQYHAMTRAISVNDLSSLSEIETLGIIYRRGALGQFWDLAVGMGFDLGT